MTSGSLGPTSYNWLDNSRAPARAAGNPIATPMRTSVSVSRRTRRCTSRAAGAERHPDADLPVRCAVT